MTPRNMKPMSFGDRIPRDAWRLLFLMMLAASVWNSIIVLVCSALTVAAVFCVALFWIKLRNLVSLGLARSYAFAKTRFWSLAPTYNAKVVVDSPPPEPFRDPVLDSFRCLRVGPLLPPELRTVVRLDSPIVIRERYRTQRPVLMMPHRPTSPTPSPAVAKPATPAPQPKPQPEPQPQVAAAVTAVPSPARYAKNHLFGFCTIETPRPPLMRELLPPRDASGVAAVASASVATITTMPAPTVLVTPTPTAAPASSSPHPSVVSVPEPTEPALSAPPATTLAATSPARRTSALKVSIKLAPKPVPSSSTSSSSKKATPRPVAAERTASLAPVLKTPTPPIIDDEPAAKSTPPTLQQCAEVSVAVPAVVSAADASTSAFIGDALSAEPPAPSSHSPTPAPSQQPTSRRARPTKRTRKPRQQLCPAATAAAKEALVMQITDFDYALEHSVGEISAMLATLCIDTTLAVPIPELAPTVEPEPEPEPEPESTVEPSTAEHTSLSSSCADVVVVTDVSLEAVEPTSPDPVEPPKQRARNTSRRRSRRHPRSITDMATSAVETCSVESPAPLSSPCPDELVIVEEMAVVETLSSQHIQSDTDPMDVETEVSSTSRWQDSPEPARFFVFPAAQEPMDVTESDSHLPTTDPIVTTTTYPEPMEIQETPTLRAPPVAPLVAPVMPQPSRLTVRIPVPVPAGASGFTAPAPSPQQLPSFMRRMTPGQDMTEQLRQLYQAGRQQQRQQPVSPLFASPAQPPASSNGFSTGKQDQMQNKPAPLPPKRRVCDLDDDDLSMDSVADALLSLKNPPPQHVCVPIPDTFPPLKPVSKVVRITEEDSDDDEPFFLPDIATADAKSVVILTGDKEAKKAAEEAAQDPDCPERTRKPKRAMDQSNKAGAAKRRN